MSSINLRAIGAPIVAGLAWFMLFMGISMGLVMLNARITPDYAWFPLPVLALVIGSSIVAQLRWDIGLSHPKGVAWGRVYLLMFTATIAGICVTILQGAWFGMTRAAELGPSGTSAQFQFAYAFVLGLVAAILAEVAFRGIMQGRLHAVLTPLPAILLVAAVNTAAHRWGPDLAAQWFGYFVLLAGCGYARWLSGSVLPPLTAHFLQNLALATATYYAGPFALGELSTTALAITAVIGAAALLLTIAIGAGMRPVAAAKGLAAAA